MGWFRRVRGKGPKAPASEPAIPTHNREESVDLVEINHADADGYSDDVPQAPLGPGGRISTLHISPSETNLYLQALAGLDKVNPNLPLWAEPAPALPDLSIETEAIAAPNIPYPSTPDIIPALHPNRQNRQHGLLLLSGDATVQITGFPNIVIPDIDAALQTWKAGVASRSDDLEEVAKRHPEMPVCWRAELKGKVWRLKGTQELESIRLMLAIFSALARHGYTMVGAIQPAVSKPESHSLLFTYTPDIEEVPPLFFAVTLPLPDRISLVNPPLRLSAQLLTSIRTAITSLHRPPPSPTPSHFRAIQLEGWVHPGVYRFWLAGLRRWPAGAGGVKRDVITRLQPLLVLGIADAVKSLKFAFVGSVPLLPRTTARDVLIFSSCPESGLCHRDAYSEESERNRLSALYSSADARSRQANADEHTNGSSHRQRERNPSLIDRPHPVHIHSRSGGSNTSTDFYPGVHSSASSSTARRSLQKHQTAGSYDESTSPTSPAKRNVHKLQSTGSYDESTFSRPSARTSLERERRPSIERRSNDSRRPSHAQPPAYSDRDRPSTATARKVLPDPPRMPFANSPSPATSPLSSPTSPVLYELPQISYNDFLYQPLGNGNGNGSMRTNSGSGTFGLAATPSPSLYHQPHPLSGGPVMAYPPLSPDQAAEKAEGHVPLLAIDTYPVSTHSRYSSDSSTTRADDDWNPEPSNTIKSPASDISSQFVTPPSSPRPPSRSRSPNPYAVSGTSQAVAKAGVSPTPIPVPPRAPRRLPHYTAAHQAHSPRHAHGDSHAETVRVISRDRATMLSRASVRSVDSQMSAASSRPPGVGSTRTRINLSMSRE